MLACKRQADALMCCCADDMICCPNSYWEMCLLVVGAWRWKSVSNGRFYLGVEPFRYIKLFSETQCSLCSISKFCNTRIVDGHKYRAVKGVRILNRYSSQLFHPLLKFFGIPPSVKNRCDINNASSL